MVGSLNVGEENEMGCDWTLKLEEQQRVSIGTFPGDSRGRGVPLPDLLVPHRCLEVLWGLKHFPGRGVSLRLASPLYKGLGRAIQSGLDQRPTPGFRATVPLGRCLCYTPLTQV